MSITTWLIVNLIATICGFLIEAASESKRQRVLVALFATVGVITASITALVGQQESEKENNLVKAELSSTARNVMDANNKIINLSLLLAHTSEQLAWSNSQITTANQKINEVRGLFPGNKTLGVHLNDLQKGLSIPITAVTLKVDVILDALKTIQPDGDLGKTVADIEVGVRPIVDIKSAILPDGQANLYTLVKGLVEIDLAAKLATILVGLQGDEKQRGINQRLSSNEQNIDDIRRDYYSDKNKLEDRLSRIEGQLKQDHQLVPVTAPINIHGE